MLDMHCCCDTSNDIVKMIETTAKRHRLLSPTDYEPPSRRPSPALLDELIFEILLRLPVRSLLRFRCVCKSWKSLISDPQFAKVHLRHSISDPSMTRQQVISSIINERCKIVSFSVQSLFQNPSIPAKAIYFRRRRKYHILGSCNGLVCLYYFSRGYVRLWNPSAKLRSKRSPIVVSRNGSVSYHGFGYDQVNDKYKVLVAVDGLDDETVTKVYTFGANSWTTIQNFPQAPIGCLGKFVSGTLNWVVKRGDDSFVQWAILSFDMEKETYGEVLLPLEQDGDKLSNPLLVILNNCLCVCFDSNRTHWVVWSMKKYGFWESWTKLMMIPHDKFRTSGWVPSFNPLCISENGVVLAKVSTNLVLYNSSNGRWLDYPSNGRKFRLNFYIYHESLVSPSC